MEKTLKVLNELEREGIIARYAIGGGIANLFYMEPVQFIPAYNDLVEEAVRESVGTAIMLQTDRPKDRARMTQLLEEVA